MPWQGLDEFRQQLRNLPEALTRDAETIVRHEAEAAEAEIRSKYPRRAGDLANGLSTTMREPGEFAIRAVLRNRAPHALVFEIGSQARHTSIGANRGSMPPGNVFVPIVQQRRKLMYERLANLLRENGMTVTGSF